MTDRDDPAVLVAGETLVDFIPDAPGPLADVESFARRPGGAPANVAVALARLGEPPWFLSNLGTDPFGDFLADTLAGYGIPDRFVTRSDHRTALAFVAHDESADRQFSFYREDTADLHVDADAVPDGALDAADWVVVGGVMLAAEPARAEIVSLVERARERGCTVVFDPNSRPELWPDAETEARVVDRVIGLADVVKTSAADLARADYPGDPDALAAALHDAGPHTALLTLGGAGAIASTTDASPWGAATAEHDGYPVRPADTTGAGDAFLGGFLAAAVEGRDLADALGFANAVAAAATTGEGAMAALPTRSEAEALRSDRE